MNKLMTIAAAAAFCATVPLAGALAQSQAIAPMPTTVDQAITAVQNAPMVTDQVQKLGETIGAVNVVPVAQLKGDQKMVDQATSKSKDDLDALRQAISANAALKQKLQDKNVSVDSVVGLDIDADHNVTVFTQA